MLLPGFEWSGYIVEPKLRVKVQLGASGMFDKNCRMAFLFELVVVGKVQYAQQKDTCWKYLELFFKALFKVARGSGLDLF